MSIVRLSVAIDDAVLDTPLELPASARAELADWQVTPGAVVTIQDSRGLFYRAHWHHDGTHLRPFERLPENVEPRWPRRLFQAIPDQQRMSWIVQKGVELGVTMVQPLHTAHSNPFPDGEAGRQQLRTWRRLALSAAKQCRRAVIPEIRAPLPLSQLLTEWRQSSDNVRRLRADVRGLRWPLSDWTRQSFQQPIDLLIGPEGGWNEQERQQTDASGVVAIALGPRVLRTETAAVAALTILMMMDDVTPSQLSIPPLCLNHS
ncbi:MAG: 16S rRNA (uracil(1498)-N(3))-methyltransferase [Magnetococcales bacterium]|nr:16S rRNA (uracil(1498)-N(3))-methyltransferase [Magnetococcales bacterium]